MLENYKLSTGKLALVSFLFFFISLGVVSAGTQGDLWDSAVRVYHLNGDAFDSRMGLNNGTVSGAVNTSGILGDAYEFDGVNDKITLGVIGTDYPASWNMWVKQKISLTKMGALGRYYEQDGYIVDSADNTRWMLRMGGGLEYATGSGQGTKDIWRMATMTYNGTDVLYYNNGTLYAQDTTSGNITHLTRSWQLATSGNNADYWNGTIDEVTFYNDSITQTEIDYLYNSGVGNELERETPVSEYPCESTWEVMYDNPNIPALRC